jgi:hypothetical protein
MFLFLAEILYLLLTAQLKPSANWYFMVGCDTAMHLGACRSAQLHHSAHRGFVGGHMVATKVAAKRSHLFLSGGAGTSLSRAVVIALVPINLQSSKSNDFTEI